jgi:DNA polymerase III alpha subunit
MHLWIKENNLKCNALIDFAIITSTCRPGWINLREKIGVDNDNCPERFKPALKETNGWLIFQEDLLSIAELVLKDLSNINIIKDFSKGINMDFYKTVFTGEEFDFLSKYAKLTFNKAHAVSYALNSLYVYRCDKK